MASKSFRPPVKSSEEMQRWFATLAAELHSRMMLNFDEFDAWPKTLTVSDPHGPAFRSFVFC